MMAFSTSSSSSRRETENMTHWFIITITANYVSMCLSKTFFMKLFFLILFFFFLLWFLSLFFTFSQQLFSIASTEVKRFRFSLMRMTTFIMTSKSQKKEIHYFIMEAKNGNLLRICLFVLNHFIFVLLYGLLASLVNWWISQKSSLFMHWNNSKSNFKTIRMAYCYSIIFYYIFFIFYLTIWMINHSENSQTI